MGKHNLIINSSVANNKLILSSNTSYTCGGTNNLLFSTSSSLKKHLETHLIMITKKYQLNISPKIPLKNVISKYDIKILLKNISNPYILKNITSELHQSS